MVSYERMTALGDISQYLTHKERALLLVHGMCGTSI